MIKKQFASGILTVFLFTSVSNQVFAASPTPEESTDEADVQKNIKDRLKKVVDEKKDQIKGISSDREKRGFVATVKRVSEETLTVETRRGTQIISLNDEVSVIQDGKAFKVSSIEIDSQVVVIGYEDGDDFQARRVLVLKKPLQTVTKTVTVGNVTKIDKTSVTIKTRSGENKIYSLNTKTIYEDNAGETIKNTDVETDQDILLITIPEDPNTQAVKDSSGRVVRLHSLAVTDDKEEETVKPTSKASPTKAATTKTPTKAPTKAAE